MKIIIAEKSYLFYACNPEQREKTVIMNCWKNTKLICENVSKDMEPVINDNIYSNMTELNNLIKTLVSIYIYQAKAYTLYIKIYNTW